MKIKFFADTICGWCYIGHSRLLKALKGFKNASFIFEHIPFQLNPNMPKKGIKRKDYLKYKFGSKEAAEPMYDSMVKEALKENLRQLIDGSLSPRTFVSEFFELSESGNLRVDIRKRLILGLLNSDTIRPSIKFLFLENLERLPVGMRTEIINEAMAGPNKPSLEAIKQELAWIRLSLPPVTLN